MLTEAKRTRRASPRWHGGNRTCGANRRGGSEEKRREANKVTVTDRAAVELQEVLRTQNAAEGEGVKLVPSDDGRVQMTIAEPEVGDEVTRLDGQPLLIVDAALAATLDGTEVDFATESTNGTGASGFTLRPAEAGR